MRGRRFGYIPTPDFDTLHPGYASYACSTTDVVHHRFPRMSVEFRNIQVDAETADTLEARAAERGISVAELLAEIAHHSRPAAAEAAEIAELDRRWAKVVGGEATVPHDDVVRWLDSWGTSAFRPLRTR
ncbi:MAG: hypothetical protein AB7S93_27445 [Xanthobacteraceae bacterium]